MNRNSIIAVMLVVSFFTVFLAFKEYFALKNQVYWDAYNGFNEPFL